MILAAKAGYNPWGMVWFFDKLEKLYGDAGFEQYVQDHPSSKDRIARIESYFKSDPAQFARWSPQTSPAPGLPLAYGSDARLEITGV